MVRGPAFGNLSNIWAILLNGRKKQSRKTFVEWVNLILWSEKFNPYLLLYNFCWNDNKEKI